MALSQHPQSVLVIGGNGFIGQHLVELLARLGHTVYATYATDQSAAPEQVLNSATWLQVDLRKPDYVSNLPHGCNAIIFLAQSPHWREFPRYADEIFKVNVSAALQAVEYARVIGAQRYIFASSGSVYPSTGQSFHESDPIQFMDSRSFYAASKLGAEFLLSAYRTFLHVIALRILMPYGPGQNPEMLLPQIVRRVRIGQPITLQGSDGLRANPVGVWEVAEAFTRCLALDQSACLNLAGPEILSLREIAETIGHVLNLSPQFEMHPDQVAPTIAADLSALESALGWKPSGTLYNGLCAWLMNIDEQSR